MAASKFVVYGVPHQVQGEKFVGSIDDECYRATLEDLIAKYKCDFIFEEAGGHVPSHAGTLANSEANPIGYVDVDPPREEREEHGLPKETGTSFPVDFWMQPACVVRLEYVDRHEAREEFWLGRIRKQAFTSALMICGIAHCLSFSFRLRQAGYEVNECVQYLPHERLCGHVLG